MNVSQRARSPSGFTLLELMVVIVLLAVFVLWASPATALTSGGAPACALGPAGISDSPLAQDQSLVKAFADNIVVGDTENSRPFYCRARAPDVSGQVLAPASQHNLIVDVQMQTLAREFTIKQQAATGIFYVYNNGTTTLMPLNSGADHAHIAPMIGANFGGFLIGNV
jgi:prepilin-type N-terminal cleavage/methylation domain-containing protein